MEKKKLLVSELKVERFELVDERVGIAVLEVTAVGECGNTEDLWVCESFESCPPSHPFQKECV